MPYDDFNNEDYQRYRASIIEARKASKKEGLIDSGMTLAKSATPWGAAALVGYMFRTHLFVYGAALTAAVIKDFLDWIGIGSLPAIGTVITVCVGIFIFFMMLLAGSTQKFRLAKLIVRRYLLLGGSVLLEMFFGLNLVPIMTFTVLAVWFMAAAETKQAMEERKKQQALEGEEGMEEEYA